MATHTYFGGASVSDWRSVDFIAVVRVTGDEIVILNSDGTETRLYSADGDFVEALGGVTGTVSSMARTDDSGAVVYETVSRVGHDVSDLLAGGGQLFDLVLGMAVTLGGERAGSDPVATGAWSQFGLASFGFGIADEVAAQASVVSYLDGFAAQSMGAPVGLGLASMEAGVDGSTALSLGYGTIGSGSALVADYGDADAGVTVDLGSDTASLGGSEVALAATVEDIVGSGFDDHLIGDVGDNVITGGKGDDIITLGAGDDTLVFGLGDGLDTVTDFGEAGLDTISLQGYEGIESFAQLLDEQRLQTVDGHAMVMLNGGDGLVLQNVASHMLLTASQFRF